MIRTFAAFTIVLLTVTSTMPCSAEDWQQPWTNVKSDAAKNCAEQFPEYQLQAVCMENEKHGYDQMQGDFGLPNDIATAAKLRCEETFPEFQLQAVCMEKETRGYDQMKKY